MLWRPFLLTAVFSVIPLVPAALLAQDNPASPAHQHMHHPGSMPGMSIDKNVKIEEKIDGQNIVVRLGPMNFPANGGMNIPQPPDLDWQVPIDGWLLGYSPKLVDTNANEVPGRLLHHTAFYNENRSDFLCPNKDEHIFGAGGEMTDWGVIPGYGYRVQMGDKIRVETMVHNPTATSYHNVYLEVKIPYQEAASGPQLKNVYPTWVDVKSCGSSGYDLPAGESDKTGTVTVKYSGVLLGVGGHMHDFARRLVMQDETKKETVVTLEAKTAPDGELISMPTVLFLDRGGYKLSAGDVLKVSADYDNTTGKLLRDGAMGIVVGYFVPANDTAMAALRHKPTTHNMAAMSHDR